MNLAIDSGAHPIVSYALSVDGSFWIDWLLTVLNALYFALPLMTGVVVGLFSGTLSTRFSTRRTVLVGLGIGLFGNRDRRRIYSVLRLLLESPLRMVLRPEPDGQFAVPNRTRCKQCTTEHQASRARSTAKENAAARHSGQGTMF